MFSFSCFLCFVCLFPSLTFGSCSWLLQVFILASLSNQSFSTKPCIMLLFVLSSPSTTHFFITQAKQLTQFMSLKIPLNSHSKIIFKLQASDTLFLTIAQTSAIIRAIPPNSLLDTETHICLLVRSQNRCCFSICVLIAVSSATTTSTVMPMTPYFMARVTMSLENSFGL